MDLPERPYLRPALRDKIDEVVGIAEDETVSALFGRGDD
jgi:hypothetical protein